MQTWEYKKLIMNVHKDSEIELNALGKQGWELVSVAALSPLVQFAFLKRPSATGSGPRP